MSDPEKAVALIAALDTKGPEADYLRNAIEARGVRCIVIDSGILGIPAFKADFTREAVFQEAGVGLPKAIALGDKGLAMKSVTRGVTGIVARLYSEGQIQGVVGIGGGQGTAVGTEAMKCLPFGVGKVMVSTIASGNTRPFVGTGDIIMVHSVCDIGGLGTLLRRVLDNTAALVAGLVHESRRAERSDVFSVGVTMLGTTTPGVTHLRGLLEGEGAEVTTFHANGVGGLAMEEFAANGFFDAVVDYSPHEVLAHVAGGVFSAGPERMQTYSQRAVPIVLAPGGVDYLIMGGMGSLSQAHLSRPYIEHNTNITLVRATADEMEKAARLIAERLNAAKGPVGVAIPLRGFSEPNQRGRAFYNPEADRRFIEALVSELQPRILVRKCDAHINDAGFAEEVADLLWELAQVEPKTMRHKSAKHKVP